MMDQSLDIERDQDKYQHESDNESIDNIPLSQLMERTQAEEGLKNAREENESKVVTRLDVKTTKNTKIKSSGSLQQPYSCSRSLGRDIHHRLQHPDVLVGFGKGWNVGKEYGYFCYGNYGSNILIKRTPHIFVTLDTFHDPSSCLKDFAW